MFSRVNSGKKNPYTNTSEPLEESYGLTFNVDCVSSLLIILYNFIVTSNTNVCVRLLKRFCVILLIHSYVTIEILILRISYVISIFRFVLPYDAYVGRHKSILFYLKEN